MTGGVTGAPATDRRLLLLGGGGFLGSNLAARLERAGHAVLVAGRSPVARDGREVIGLALEEVDAIITCVRAERIDTVVHLVSGLLPSSTATDYLAERRRVVEPTIRLGRSLAELHVGLTFFSSGGTVYGACPRPLVREDDPCEPISLYGQAKLETESHLRFLARTAGLHCLIVRPSNPYGLHQSLRGAQGLISVILGRLADGRPLEVWGDGSVVRDYIHVDDMADAVAGLIERRADGVFNIGSGEGHSLLDVVRIVEGATGRSGPVEFRPARPADVPHLVLDTGRLAAIGLQRSRPLSDGVRRYAEQLGMTRE